MRADDRKHIYGPVPSRRLGRSLGIDLVPFKTCSYDCIYCQLGRTTDKTIVRKEYVRAEEVLSELEQKLQTEDVPDYITLAGSGEPTLHAGIGKLIKEIKNLTNIPVAIITNGSLLWMEEVQDALMEADLVLPSLDAGDPDLFQYVNRPHEGISFEQMVNGLAEFTRCFTGEVWLEVFLLTGVTAIPSEVKKISALVEKIRPARVQLNTVTRPPAEEFALPVPPDLMTSLRELFPENTEIISEENENSRSPLGTHEADEEEILALLRRRPCTAEDIAESLGLNLAEALKCLESLRRTGKITTTIKDRKNFYLIEKPLLSQRPKRA
ncbi:MAG: radical SAM protein [Thermacetogeniaceae bacterium]